MIFVGVNIATELSYSMVANQQLNWRINVFFNDSSSSSLDSHVHSAINPWLLRTEDDPLRALLVTLITAKPRHSDCIQENNNTFDPFKPLSYLCQCNESMSN